MRAKFNIYVISDSHFNHWNINRYTKRRFSNLEQMNSTLIGKWNKVVRPNDIIINVGDVIFTKGESEEIKKVIKKLNGRKILVMGNHDRKSMAFYLSNGFDFVCEKFTWQFNNHRLLFLHNPNNIIARDYRDYNFIIHGHWHNKGKFVRKRGKCRIVNVSTEQLNHIPINLVTLINKVKAGCYDKRRGDKF